MIVLAHRGNLRGPDPERENSPDSIGEAVAAGYGLETDVRFASGFGFYISHDANTPTPASALEVHAEIWRRNPDCLVALNIKETGNEAQLLERLNSLNVARQVFLFDMELIEPHRGEMAARFRGFDADIVIAARVSDRQEPVSGALGLDSASAIWLDEFDGPWATRATVEELVRAGRRVYAVSPDLHGMTPSQSIRRWHEFASWGVTGICTDWPLLLSSELGLDSPHKPLPGRSNAR
jgi:glycerophosphoryl diester phosphodiesterase